MKKKIILIFPILILIICIVLFITSNHSYEKIDFNTDLKISTKDNKITSNMANLSNEYSIEETPNVEIDNDVEEKIVKVAYDMTNAFNDIDDENYIYNIEKYEVRIPSYRLSDDYLSNEEIDAWQDENITINAIAMVLRSGNYKFEEIKGYNITYASSSRYIVQVYIDNFNGNIGVTKVQLDAIFEYEIVYEEISGLYKVNKLNVEWVNDLEKYYQQMDTDERKQNDANSNTMSNVSSYIPEGYTKFDYTKLKNVSANVTNAIYEKNKNSIVIIDSASEGGIATGSASGFFIRSGIVVTSYDSVYSMIENGAVRYYAVGTDDKVHNIEGIVAAYPNINVIILKLEDETGTKVEIGDSNKLQENDPIVVMSSSLGLKTSIKLGIYFDTLQDDYKTIRTSLPLINGDSGSAVFNLNGEVVAINTSVSTTKSEYNSGLNNATDISTIKDVIAKIENESFSSIKSVSFKEFNDEEKIEVKNDVKEKIWKKYEKLPIITNYFPLNLYSAYVKDDYLIARYRQNTYTVLSNHAIISSYAKYLVNNSYEKVSDNVYVKDNIKIRINDNLGFIIIIVEGVV